MTFPIRSRAALSALTMLTFAACQADGPRGPRGGTGDAPMTASGELAIPNPKPMDAQAAFFAGSVQVEAMLAKSDEVWKSAAPSEGGERGGGRSGFSGGFGGGGGRGRGGGGRRGGGGGGEGAPPSSPGEAPPRAAAVRPSNAPPIQLRLRLTNHGEKPAEIEVLDFNSELGNFAVQPTKLTVLPHESTEADPMTSRLGVPAVEEIPITVRLRLGGKSGAVEMQILKLRPRADEAPSPSTPVTTK